VGYQTLLVERGGAIATITLNRPEARNAIDLAMRHELVAALDLEAYSQGLAVAADDHQEGLAAFFDKRTPRFTGR
jgi:2-(1,2-epoxy-1,2-dihydrophenyl)acetyl-CoA isomerase